MFEFCAKLAFLSVIQTIRVGKNTPAETEKPKKLKIFLFAQKKLCRGH